jgi:hypothetical protein
MDLAIIFLQYDYSKIATLEVVTDAPIDAYVSFKSNFMVCSIVDGARISI